MSYLTRRNIKFLPGVLIFYMNPFRFIDYKNWVVITESGKTSSFTKGFRLIGSKDKFTFRKNTLRMNTQFMYTPSPLVKALYA